MSGSPASLSAIPLLHLSFSLSLFLCFLFHREIVGLSEALLSTKLAHDDKTKQMLIWDEVEYLRKGVASARTLRPKTKTSKTKRSSQSTTLTHRKACAYYEYEHERAYYPNDLYPSSRLGSLSAWMQLHSINGRERPPSQGMRPRPASAVLESHLTCVCGCVCN